MSRNKKTATSLDELAASRTDLHFIKPSDIEPDIYETGEEGKEPERFNVREAFGESLIPSIKRNVEMHGPKYGIELPILGYFHKESGKFRLTDGERRWRDALAVEKEGIEIYMPCKPHPKNYTMENRLMDVLTTATGKGLTMVEQSRQIGRLISIGVAPKEIARARNCSTTHIKTCLALLSLPYQLVNALQKEEITATLAIDIAAELKHNPELDLDEILRAGRAERDASESDHITAKHLPIPVGKPAIAARMNGNAGHTDANESLSHAVSPGEAQADAQSGAGDRSSAASSSATVPFRDVDSTPGYGETNHDGEFIGGVTVTRWEFGKVKCEVRTAFRDKYFFGIFLSYPNDYPDGRINQPPTIHGIGYSTMEEAKLSGVQQLRAELSLLCPEKKFAVYAVGCIDKLIEELTGFHTPAEQSTETPAPASTPAPAPAQEKQEQVPLVEKTPLEILVAVLEPLQRKLCEPVRYDTLHNIVKLLKGKSTPLDLSKFIMGITD